MRFDLDEIVSYVGGAGVVGLIWAITKAIQTIRRQNAANRAQDVEHVDVVVARQQKWIEEQDAVIARLKAEVIECTERHERLSAEFRAHRTKQEADAFESNRRLSDLRRENDELRAEIAWMKRALALIPGSAPHASIEEAS